LASRDEVGPPVTKKQLFSFRKLPCNYEVTGHCMCKEMLVMPVSRVADKKRIMGKMEGRRGREAQGQGCQIFLGT
jgi:hypothetical protein